MVLTHEIRLSLVVVLIALAAGTAAQPVAAQSLPAIPGYTLQETVSVPASGGSVTSANTLQSGVVYRIRTSGTVTAGGPGDGLADAEYSNFSNPPTSLADLTGADCLGDGGLGPGGVVDLGIGVNDRVNGPNRKNPHWGAFQASHVYVIDFVGQGSPIGLNYHDCYYPDNSGAFSVEIWSPLAGTSAQSTAVAPGATGSAALLAQPGGLSLRASLSHGFPPSPFFPATLTIGSYAANPVAAAPVSFGFGDLRATGTISGDVLAASLYYPPAPIYPPSPIHPPNPFCQPSPSSSVMLVYFSGSTWHAVCSSGGASPTVAATPNLDGTSSAGRIQLSFDATSTPTLAALSGTVFGVVDIAPPTDSPTLSPVPNAAGWNNTDVTVNWNWTDNPGGSGVNSNNCTTSSTSSGEGVQVLTASCQDLTGNVGTATQTVKVDKTPPAVAVTGVSNGATYTLGSVPTAGCSTSDTLSGVSTLASLQVTGGTSNGVGTFTATCSGASDRAANTAPLASAIYTVNYTFSGYLAPVDNPNTVNAGKAGRSYPVKWQLTTSGGYVSALSAVTSLTTKATSCTAFNGDPTDALETSTTGSSSLRYDSTANEYLYNWATPSTTGCYTLFVTLDSGQVFPAYFNLS